MSILPDDGEGIGSHRDNIGDARGGYISQLDIEHIRVWFGPHVLMSAAAGGAGTSGAQQFKRIDARVIVIPCDRKFSGLLIGSNTSWFFIHR